MSHSRKEITDTATSKPGITVAKLQEAVAEELLDTADALRAETGDVGIANAQKSMIDVATVLPLAVMTCQPLRVKQLNGLINKTQRATIIEKNTE